MALHGYGGLMSDPDTLRQRYHPEAPPRGHSTVHGYANDEVDRLAEAQLTATDPDERREIVADLQREIAEDLPVLSTYVLTRYLFYERGDFRRLVLHARLQSLPWQPQQAHVRHRPGDRPAQSVAILTCRCARHWGCHLRS